MNTKLAAIRVTFLSPTNTKGARLKAVKLVNSDFDSRPDTSDESQITRGRDYSVNAREDARLLAMELMLPNERYFAIDCARSVTFYPEVWAEPVTVYRLPAHLQS